MPDASVAHGSSGGRRHDLLRPPSEIGGRHPVAGERHQARHPEGERRHGGLGLDGRSDIPTRIPRRPGAGHRPRRRRDLRQPRCRPEVGPHDTTRPTGDRRGTTDPRRTRRPRRPLNGPNGPAWWRSQRVGSITGSDRAPPSTRRRSGTTRRPAWCDHASVPPPNRVRASRMARAAGVGSGHGFAWPARQVDVDPGRRPAGNRRVTVVPSPGSLVMSRVPPWASVAAATIARPSPLPPCRRDRDGSAR